MDFPLAPISTNYLSYKCLPDTHISWIRLYSMTTVHRYDNNWLYFGRFTSDECAWFIIEPSYFLFIISFISLQTALRVPLQIITVTLQSLRCSTSFPGMLLGPLRLFVTCMDGHLDGHGSLNDALTVPTWTLHVHGKTTNMDLGTSITMVNALVPSMCYVYRLRSRNICGEAMAAVITRGLSDACV